MSVMQKVVNRDLYRDIRTSDGIEFVTRKFLHPQEESMIYVDGNLSAFYSENFSEFDSKGFRTYLKSTFPKENWDKMHDLNWKIEKTGKNDYRLVEETANKEVVFNKKSEAEEQKIVQQGLYLKDRRYEIFITCHPKFPQYTGPNILFLQGSIFGVGETDLEVLKPFEIGEFRPPSEKRDFYIHAHKNFLDLIDELCVFP